jgi:DNA-directed RNA polymerase subunit E'/Rpb7
MPMTKFIEKTISSKIHLAPSELDDVSYNIGLKIKNNSECTEEHGYPIEFVELLSYASNTIAPTGTCIFSATYTMCFLKPAIGQRYACEITEIYPQGVFAVFSQLKILIPATNMKEYVYSNCLGREEMFVHVSDVSDVSATENNLKTTDVIEVIITQLAYEKHSYLCIGDLAH